jgi:hypothetical protein
MESMVFPNGFSHQVPLGVLFFSPETHALYHLGLPGSCCLPFKSLSGSVGTVPRNGERHEEQKPFYF